MVSCKDWFEAIRCNDTNELMRLVTKTNVNTRVTEEGGGGEYTPVQFLARISPGNSLEMLKYLLSLGADLSLMAHTVDCISIISRYCTTIGNLASYRIGDKCKWWDSKAHKESFYNRGKNPSSMDKHCHSKTNLMYDALSELKQEGKNVPGLNISSWVTRGARKLLRGTGEAAKGVLLLSAASGPTSFERPSYNTSRKGGRKAVKSFKRSKRQTRRN